MRRADLIDRICSSSLKVLMVVAFSKSALVHSSACACASVAALVVHITRTTFWSPVCAYWSKALKKIWMIVVDNNLKLFGSFIRKGWLAWSISPLVIQIWNFIWFHHLPLEAINKSKVATKAARFILLQKYFAIRENKFHAHWLELLEWLIYNCDE